MKLECEEQAMQERVLLLLFEVATNSLFTSEGLSVVRGKAKNEKISKSELLGQTRTYHLG